MDELFDVEKMESSLKMAKKRTTRKMIYISLLIVVLFGCTIIIGLVINNQFVQKSALEIETSFKYFNEISGPNEFVGVTEVYPGLLGGENHYKKYKWIAGELVLSSEGTYGYGFLRNQKMNSGRFTSHIFTGAEKQEDIQNVYYNDNGQRIMTFFYPQIQYDEVNHDLSLLTNLPDEMLVEIALSFDKGYSVKEAEQLLPDYVHPSWFWVNDVKEISDLYMYEYSGEKEINKQPLVRNSKNVYGFSLIDNFGQVIENPAQQFIDAIQDGSKIESRWQTEFKRLQETIGNNNTINVSELVINGVVLTGTAKELKALEREIFIKASSLGMSTSPY